MYNRIGGLLTAAVVTATLAGCSSGNSSSSTVSVNVRMGQDDFKDAYIWSVTVDEGGQVNTDSASNLAYTEYATEDDASVSITIPSEEVHQFTLIGKKVDEDLDVDGTTRKCQWVDGCTDLDGNAVDFGSRYTVAGELWSTVAYDLAENERIMITPFTGLAASVAYNLLYVESTAEWQQTGYYSAWSVLQSVDVMSTQLGVDDIQITRPADLTNINSFTGDQATAMDRIRYGALVAAWTHLEETDTTGTLLDDVAADLVSNSGQWMQAGDTQTLSLAALYQDARDNLAALTVTNTTAASYVALVIADFDDEIADLEEDALTETVPATIESMVGSDDYEDFTVGLQRTKAFVGQLQDVQTSFFEDGYRDTVDDYLDTLKDFGDEHEDEFNDFLQAFIDTYELYSSCYLNAGCPTPDSSLTWLDSIDSYNSSTGKLVLNGGDIVVTQRVADTNTTDDDDTPSSSHAIDVLIVGTFNIGDMVFKVDHYYEDDDSSNDIELPSAVRVYFTDEVSALDDPDNNEVIGYELRWGDFEFYDSTTRYTSDRLQVGGSFRLFYRGVRDPQDDTSELHFNIDTVALDGRVSDSFSDDDDDDNYSTDIYVAASAANASEYYPEKQFASFNGFFNPNTSDEFTEGSVESDLVSYRTGSQTISSQTVEYLDVIVPKGESIRYRLYPNVQREDSDDLDGDDDEDELIYTHDVELCYLEESDSDWVVDSCEPKSRIYGETDLTEYINDLWKTGVLSRISIDGRGTYFVEWPANSTDDHGCMVLDDLDSDGGSFDGTLYDAMVLGLNSLRFQTEVELKGEPDTLFDMYLTAPNSSDYYVTAALSHDYSSTTTSGNITVGTGSSLDRIKLSYRTDYDFDTVGSLVIFKDGTKLALDDGTTDTVDSTLSLYLKQSKDLDPLPYTSYVNDDGEYETCVTANQAESDESTDITSATFYLNYRDVVYGTVKQESGVWVVRYIDGTFETLQ
ncbi:hypothetical protein [Oceanobacter mangrovi]|uniref:hypothetical protein n=1 Tax=Oceanobacter mangrovi TaxID=2862510 RepID=UPI001C8DDA86|nr:hypothetical protein [Oceanobacter mangrovi]